MTKHFVCEDVNEQGEAIPGTGCGEIDHVLFDGYSIGERILEQVMFKVFLKDGEIAVDSKDEWDKDPYLSGLNKNYWMERALNFAKKNDIATCPKCGNDVDALPR